jgi:hypothetical protein
MYHVLATIVSIIDVIVAGRRESLIRVWISPQPVGSIFRAGRIMLVWTHSSIVQAATTQLPVISGMYVCQGLL